MADTTFSDGATLIVAAWLNDINDFFYTTFGGQSGGGITATTARTALSAAKSGANSDITSLSALSTALSVAQGGTSLTSVGAANTVLTSNGSVPAWTALATTHNTVYASTFAAGRLPGDQTIGASAWVVIDFEDDLGDPGSNFANATNKYTVPSTGIYNITAGIGTTSAFGTVADELILAAKVNTTYHLLDDIRVASATASVIPACSGSINLSLTAADTIEFVVYQSSSDGNEILDQTKARDSQNIYPCYFSIMRIA